MNEAGSREVSAYQDPEVIAASQGDPGLLDRLVALRISENRLQADPGDEQAGRVYVQMNEDIEDYCQTHNLQLPKQMQIS